MFNMTKSSVSQEIPSTPTPCIPAKAGTQALSSPQVSDRAPVSSASLAVAQTWVPAFAGMHGWGRGPRLAKMHGWGDGGGIRIQKMRYFNTVIE